MTMQFDSFTQLVRSGRQTDQSSLSSYFTYLFKLEDMLIEVILQMFVGVVNTELFKAVLIEVFESKDIQNSYRVTLGIFVILLLVEGMVDLPHHPVKYSTI